MEKLVWLLEEKEIYVDIEDDVGMTAIVGAAFKGHYDIVRVLIERGANVDHANLANGTYVGGGGSRPSGWV